MGNEQQETIHIKGKNKQVSSKIEDNVQYVSSAFYHTDDLKTRKIKWQDRTGMIVYLDTMVDAKQFQQGFLSPLAEANDDKQIEKIIASPEYKETNNLNEIVKDLLSGNCALFMEKSTKCILFNSAQSNNRSPDEPDSEKTVRGAHKGFVEDIEVNLNIIRDYVKNSSLTFRFFNLGIDSNTKVAMIYMSDIANPSVVEEVERRIKSVSLDMAFTPGFIEECLEDSPFSPFPQILFSERPDRVEANLMEGRVAIMADGSSDVSMVPVTFFSFFQSPDDYNIRFYGGSFFRLLRFLSFFGTLILPALYIAVVAFHFEIIPYDMVRIVKSSIENIPFSPFVEALIMAITVELIREAGIRLPTPIGQTIGIVGGLIIGDAVVNAGLISNLMVIVIALTAIMSFGIPSYEMGNTVRLLSFPVMLSAATLGFVGIVFSFMIILIHLCKLDSFGTPYLSPVAPFHVKNIKDTISRFPNWTMNKRPKGIHAQIEIRQDESREWDHHDK